MRPLRKSGRFVVFGTGGFEDDEPTKYHYPVAGQLEILTTGIDAPDAGAISFDFLNIVRAFYS